ncbi:unnamed protein product [Citrullus colocynthis]|uniref:Uncharacterized protein n=1 Tax=Citrullus colocynthis TaxID=252529 RepID=A0ABP0XSA8_9ROSI
MEVEIEPFISPKSTAAAAAAIGCATHSKPSHIGRLCATPRHGAPEGALRSVGLCLCAAAAQISMVHRERRRRRSRGRRRRRRRRRRRKNH